jgi:hypothetical protein
MGVVDQGEQEMLERRIFVTAAARFAERVVQRLFELTGKTESGSRSCLASSFKGSSGLSGKSSSRSMAGALTQAPLKSIKTPPERQRSDCIGSAALDIRCRDFRVAG